MDYKEKYEQCLERAQQAVHKGYVSQNFVDDIFPELRESEDERVRKEIIDFLGLPHPQFVGKRDHEKWIAWLEKQNKTLDPDKVIEWLDKQACLGWLEDVEVEKVVEQFKKDFEL